MIFYFLKKEWLRHSKLADGLENKETSEPMENALKYRVYINLIIVLNNVNFSEENYFNDSLF